MAIHVYVRTRVPGICVPLVQVYHMVPHVPKGTTSWYGTIWYTCTYSSTMVPWYGIWEYHCYYAILYAIVASVVMSLSAAEPGGDVDEQLMLMR